MQVESLLAQPFSGRLALLLESAETVTDRGAQYVLQSAFKNAVGRLGATMALSAAHRLVREMELIAEMEVDPQIYIVSATLSHAVATADLDCVNRLMASSSIPPSQLVETLHECLIAAASSGCDIVARALLQNEAVRARFKEPLLESGLLESSVLDRVLNLQRRSVLAVMLDPASGVLINANDRLCSAAFRGDISEVEALLQPGQADPAAARHLVLRLATVNGQEAAVRRLLADARVDAAVRHNVAVREAATYGHTSIVRLLLEHSAAVDASDVANDSLVLAAKHGHADVVALLLDSGGCSDEYLCCRTGYWDFYAHCLCSDDNVVVAAARAGHYHIVAHLLNNADFRFDSNADECPLRAAAEEGHLAIVELLLEWGQDDRWEWDKSWHPSLCPCCHSRAPACTALEAAACKGRTDIVRLVLKHRHWRTAIGPGSNPANNPAATAFVQAAAGGHTSVMDLLMSPEADFLNHCQPVHPSVLGGDALRLAARNGHLHVVEQLLADPRCDPSACDYSPLLAALRHGRFEVVERLLADPRVDASVTDWLVAWLAHDARLSGPNRDEAFSLIDLLLTQLPVLRRRLAAGPCHLPAGVHMHVYAAAMGRAAWARRRAAVLGRAQAVD